MALAHKAATRNTYGDYLAWDNSERWEIIHGEAHATTPAPSRAHQQAVLRMARSFDEALESGPCEVCIAPFDIRLPEPDESDDATTTVVQPDLVVVCDPGKLDEHGCKGGPDLVAEVLSPATAARDNIQKLALRAARRARILAGPPHGPHRHRVPARRLGPLRQARGLRGPGSGAGDGPARGGHRPLADFQGLRPPPRTISTIQRSTMAVFDHPCLSCWTTCLLH